MQGLFKEVWITLVPTVLKQLLGTRNLTCLSSWVRPWREKRPTQAALLVWSGFFGWFFFWGGWGEVVVILLWVFFFFPQSLHHLTIQIHHCIPQTEPL